MEKKTPYFSHDFNAHDDQKIQSLCSVYRWEGYGWYWYILELMAIEENYMMEESEYLYRTLARRFQTNENKIKKFLKDCKELKLFQTDLNKKNLFYSESFLKRMKMRDEKILKCRESGIKSGMKRNERLTDDEPTGIERLTDAEQYKLNEIKLNETKKKKEITIVQTSNFDFFWSLYPRKQSKFKAKQVWDKLNPNEELFENIITGLERYMKSSDVKKGFVQLPTTWLNGREWESEYDVQIKKNDLEGFLGGEQ